MFLLGIINNFDNEVNDVLGVFDTYEKAHEKQLELNKIVGSNFRLYVIKYDLNELYTNYLKKHLKED